MMEVFCWKGKSFHSGKVGWEGGGRKTSYRNTATSQMRRPKR